MGELPRGIDITKPKWDQTTYIGRVKHFFYVTNPLNIFASSKALDNAKEIYDKYRTGKPLPSGTTIDDVWKAKYLYDSAFHPNTGEKMIVIGRMSAKMPLDTVLTGAMLAYYHSNAATIFWQWTNQSINAVINYSNRSGEDTMGVQQLGITYVLATSGALVTALTLNKQAKKAPPIVGRWVPFIAVAAANCINIPCMRSKELKDGLPVYDANNNKIANSRKAAREGISTVVFSRILMASPTMVCIPIIVDYLEKRRFFVKYPRSNLPLQVGLCAFILAFSTPMACAIVSQIVPVKINRLEKEVQEAARKMSPVPEIGYYNKGL